MKPGPMKQELPQKLTKNMACGHPREGLLPPPPRCDCRVPRWSLSDSMLREARQHPLDRGPQGPRLLRTWLKLRGLQKRTRMETWTWDLRGVLEGCQELRSPQEEAQTSSPSLFRRVSCETNTPLPFAIENREVRKCSHLVGEYWDYPKKKTSPQRERGQPAMDNVNTLPKCPAFR